jgi:Raf kinase inhibitor-like YbhB/YbcL family protein
MNIMNLFSKLALVTALSLGVSSISDAAKTSVNHFRLSSTSIKDGAPIRAEHYWNNFGCTGGNIMPDLVWENAPKDTKSFAITFYDKDAPTGSGFWHWVAYDIPATTKRLAGGLNGGTLPEGSIEGNTDLSKPGFFGPCPPVGREHHYIYTVYAVKVDKLPVEKGASAALVGFMLWQNTLAKASFTVKAGPRK